MFHTNSRVACAKDAESFMPLLLNMTIGGRSQTALKNEYGARLTSPPAPSVETHPIGRGAISALNGSCGSSCWSRADGSEQITASVLLHQRRRARRALRPGPFGQAVSP